MHVLIVRNDAHTDWVDEDFQDAGWTVTLAMSEKAANEQIDRIAEGKQPCDAILICDERIKNMTVDDVMKISREELAAWGDTRETGVRLCERVQRLGLLERGVSVICASVLFRYFGDEIKDRVDATGVRFIDQQYLGRAVRRLTRRVEHNV